MSANHPKRTIPRQLNGEQEVDSKRVTLPIFGPARPRLSEHPGQANYLWRYRLTREVNPRNPQGLRPESVIGRRD
jgi:hypothetical protein